MCNVLCADRREVDSDTTRWQRCNCLYNSLYKLVLILVFATFCGGCAVGPNFSTPPPPVLPPSYVLMGNEPAVPLDTWWQVFADEKLNALISKGYANNLDARVAYERVIEARSNLQSQSSRRRGTSNVDSSFRLGNPVFDASWQVDLFGKLQRSKEAAAAELSFEENEAQFVRQTLLSDIARCYLQVRLLQNQHELAQQSIAVEEQTAMLVEQRKEAGLSNDLDLAQTRSLQQRIMALQADLRQQLEVELNQLSVLVGEAPSFDMRGFIDFAAIPQVPPMSEVGFPADLLRRRPDIRREESVLVASVAKIGIAEADLFRSLPLLGTISAGAQKITGMFQTGLFNFGAIPPARWNSSRFGRVASGIEIRESQCRQAFYIYQKTVIEAAREVEDALARHQSFRAQMLLLNQAVSADELAVELSLQRYDAGQAEFQTFLEAQQQLVTDLQNRAQTQANAVEQLIRLYNALGGSWRPVNEIPIEFHHAEFSQPEFHHAELHHTELHHTEFFQPEFQPMASQNNFVKSPVRPPVIYVLPPSDSDPLDQQPNFPGLNLGENHLREPFVPREFAPVKPFANPPTQSVLPQSIIQRTNEFPLAPLPSPEAFDGFPSIEDEDLLGPPLPPTGSGLPVQKVPHKVPEP